MSHTVRGFMWHTRARNREHKVFTVLPKPNSRVAHTEHIAMMLVSCYRDRACKGNIPLGIPSACTIAHALIEQQLTNTDTRYSNRSIRIPSSKVVDLSRVRSRGHAISGPRAARHSLARVSRRSKRKRHENSPFSKRSERRRACINARTRNSIYGQVSHSAQTAPISYSWPRMF